MGVGLLPESLETRRLVLRIWRAEDADALGAAITASLEHLRPWMPWIAFEPRSSADRAAFIEQSNNERAEGGDATYGVFRDGEIVGGAGLHRRAGPDTLEIGYWIHVDHLRNGYASEASSALTSAAFEDPEIQFVEIHHDRANVSSAGIPRKLGYQLVGEHPDPITSPGDVGIDCCWRISRAAWAEPNPDRAEC